jgi:hypothetical protein
MHGFGFTLHRSSPQFCVPIGVDVPCLRPKADYMMQGRCPSLTVSHRLGEFRNGMRGSESWYTFSTETDLVEVLKRVHEDFVEQALPWLNQFNTLDDVAAAYYRRNIGPPLTGEIRRPNPFAWAWYGWMLEEMRRAEESKVWLKRASDELAKPMYMKEGKLLADWELGAKELARSGEEKRLEKLLEESLRGR